MKKTTIILFLCGICLFVGNVSARSGRGSALSQACMYASGQLEVSDFAFLHNYVGGGGIYSKSLIPKEAMKPIQICNNGPLCVDVFVAGSQYFQNQDIVTYTVSATNNSSATMAVIELTVNLPTQLTYVSTGSSAWASSGSVCIIQAANVLPSQTVSFTLVAKVGASNTSNCFVPMLTSATAATQYTNGWLYVTETEAVYLLPDAVQTRLYNAQSSTIGTSLSGFVFSEGTLRIDNGFSFQSANLLMAQDANILVGDGNFSATLELINTNMYGCLRMWDEIKVENGSAISTTNSTLSDGYYAINAKYNTIIKINNTIFEDNFIGLYIPSGIGVVTSFGGLNIFQSNSSNLLPKPTQQTVVVGSRGYSGIKVDGDGFMDVKGCQFIGLNTGLRAHKSIVTVKDCYFENIYEDFSYNGLGGINYPVNGAGICVTRMSKLTYIGTFPAATDFEDCQTGIFSHGSAVNITNANMQRIKEWGIRFTHPLLQTGVITGNRINTDGNGISVEFAENSTNVDVAANTINLNQTEDRPGIGIQVVEQSLAIADNIDITDNDIYSFRPGIGIWVNGCNDTRVLSNTVTFDNILNVGVGIPGGSSGILISGSTGINTSCNFVQGSGGIQLFNMANNPDLQQAAIRVERSPNGMYQCNNTIGSYYGFFFQDDCTADERFLQNWMLGHYFGLFITITGNIGEQGYVLLTNPNAVGPNNWWQFPWNNSPGAMAAISFSPFQVDLLVDENQPCLNGDVMFPPFTSDFSSTLLVFNISCDAAGNPASCQPAICGTPTPTSLIISSTDSTLLTDAFISSTFQYPIKWSSQKMLYSKLLENPLLLNDTEIASFFTNKYTSSVGKFAMLEWDIRQELNLGSDSLQYIDSLISYQYQLVLAIDTLLSMPNADSLNLLIQRKNQIQELTSLQNSYVEILTKGMITRSATITQLEIENQSTSYDSIYEVNQQTVDAIYLSTFAKGIYSFTPAQVSVLDAIAHQCPLSGGQAVFDARSLYAWVAGAQFYDDTGNCAQQGLNYRQSQVEAPEIYKVYPNPAQSLLTVEVPSQAEMSYTFTLYTLNGTAVGTWICDEPQTEIHTNGIALGMYFYTLTDGKSIVSTGKLSIL